MSQSLQSDEFMQAAMDTWGDTVFRVALSHTQSFHDAQDVTQDVFVRLLTSQKNFTSNEHLKAWLLRVAVNRCYELARQRQSRVTSVPDDALYRTLEAAEARDAQWGTSPRNSGF